MKKLSSIMFDDTPTEDSENAITSGGVFKAIQSGGGGGSSYDDTELRNRIGEAERDIGNLETDFADLQTAVTANSDNIGNLANLSTTVKTDLVSALNEVASGSGGGSSGTTINKHTIASASRSISYGRVQIDMENTVLVGKTIIGVELKVNNTVSGQYKVIGACMDSEFFDAHIINELGADFAGMMRMSSTLNIGFDVYYI